jgi:tetratricopeptide (TPR) repeat protein
MTFVALQHLPQLGISGKVAVSAYSLAFYVWKTLAPLNLSPLYAMPAHVGPAEPRFLVAYAVVVALVAYVAWAIARRRGIAAALVAFVVLLLPLLGFVQNGPQLVADRYTYDAGAVVGLVAGAALLRYSRSRRWPQLAAAAVVVVLAALTWRQTGVWHDSASVWAQVARVEPDSPIALNNLANQLMQQGRVDEAIARYRRATAVAPDYAEAHNNLGVAFAKQGRLDEALAEYATALDKDPANADAHDNWGVALAARGDLAGAVSQYEQALAIDAAHADAHVNLGNALSRLGRRDEAIEQYRQALAARPDHADAHLNWGVVLAQQGKFAEAADHFRAVLAIDPSRVDARQYLERVSR